MGVDPNWSLAGGGNNALAMFQAGAQMGQQAQDRRAQHQQQNALLQLRQQELDAKLKGEQQQAQQKAQEQHRNDIPIMAHLLDHATDETSYQQARAAATQYGIDLSGVPQAYDPNWVGQQKMLLQAIQTKEGQQALSVMGKQAMDEGFRPGTPEFAHRVHEIWSVEQSKTIPTTAGGGVAQFNPETGQTQFVIQPNDGSHPAGAAAGSVPPPPPGFHLDQGGPTLPASGGFLGAFSDYRR